MLFRMPDVLWWREETWYERKSIPLGAFSLAPRQLILVFIFGLLGVLASAPFPGTLMGVPLLGKLLVMGIFLFAGYILSSRRVKTVPVELQIAYRLAGWGKRGGVKGKEAPTKAEKGEVKEAAAAEEEAGIEIVEDWNNPVPRSYTGKLKVNAPAKVYLLVDGLRRAEDVVSPAKSHYRLLYAPGPEDVGTHMVAVKVEGAKEPLEEEKITIKASGVGLLESKK